MLSDRRALLEGAGLPLARASRSRRGSAASRARDRRSRAPQRFAGGEGRGGAGTGDLAPRNFPALPGIGYPDAT